MSNTLIYTWNSRWLLCKSWHNGNDIDSLGNLPRTTSSFHSHVPDLRPTGCRTDNPHEWNSYMMSISNDLSAFHLCLSEWGWNHRWGARCHMFNTLLTKLGLGKHWSLETMGREGEAVYKHSGQMLGSEVRTPCGIPHPMLESLLSAQALLHLSFLHRVTPGGSRWWSRSVVPGTQGRDRVSGLSPSQLGLLQHLGSAINGWSVPPFLPFCFNHPPSLHHVCFCVFLFFFIKLK